MAKRAGVGLALEQAMPETLCYVADIQPGGSAAHSGQVHVGDKIVSVDGRNVQGMALSDVGQLMGGPDGSMMTLGIIRTTSVLFGPDREDVLEVHLRRGVPVLYALSPDDKYTQASKSPPHRVKPGHRREAGSPIPDDIMPVGGYVRPSQDSHHMSAAGTDAGHRDVSYVSEVFSGHVTQYFDDHETQVSTRGGRKSKNEAGGMHVLDDAHRMTAGEGGGLSDHVGVGGGMRRDRLAEDTTYVLQNASVLGKMVQGGTKGGEIGSKGGEARHQRGRNGAGGKMPYDAAGKDASGGKDTFASTEIFARKDIFGSGNAGMSGGGEMGELVAELMVLKAFLSEEGGHKGSQGLSLDRSEYIKNSKSEAAQLLRSIFKKVSDLKAREGTLEELLRKARDKLATRKSQIETLGGALKAEKESKDSREKEKQDKVNEMEIRLRRAQGREAESNAAATALQRELAEAKAEIARMRDAKATMSSVSSTISSHSNGGGRGSGTAFEWEERAQQLGLTTRHTTTTTSAREYLPSELTSSARARTYNSSLPVHESTRHDAATRNYSTKDATARNYPSNLPTDVGLVTLHRKGSSGSGTSGGDMQAVDTDPSFKL